MGEVLVSERIITEEQLSQAKDHQKITGKTLVRTLIDLGLINESTKNELLKSKFGFEVTPISPEMVDQDVLRLIPRREAERHHLAPIKFDGDYLVVAMEEPQNVMVVDYIKTLTGHRVRPVAAESGAIQRVLDEYPAEDRRIDLTRAPLFWRLSANLLFFIIYFLPLIVFMYLIFSNSPLAERFKGRITGASSFEVGLMLGLSWGAWALIIFEITGLVFQTSKEE